MAEVSIIMAKLTGDARLAQPKLWRSLDNSLRYLDDHLAHVVAALPEGRLLSFFEVTLSSVVTHLPFREVMGVDGYPASSNSADGSARAAALAQPSTRSTSRDAGPSSC